MTNMIDWIPLGTLTGLHEIGTTLAFALLAYLLGLRAYHHQKEFESIRSRYLENTINRFVGHMEHCLSVYRMNWQHGLAVLKLFKDAGSETPMEALSRVHRVDHANLQIATGHRLGTLLQGDTTFFQMHQLLVAFVERGVAFIENDLGMAIRFTAEGHIPASKHTETIQKYEDALRNLDAESKPYYQMLVELQTIGMEFENARFTYRTLKRFYKRTNVIKSLARAKEVLDEVIEQVSEPSTQPTVCRDGEPAAQP